MELPSKRKHSDVSAMEQDIEDQFSTSELADQERTLPHDKGDMSLRIMCSFAQA